MVVQKTVDFLQTSSGSDIADYENDIFLEIDFLLQNGAKAMLVNVEQ